MKIVKEWGPMVVVIAVIVAVRLFVLSPILVSGHSMDPGLQDGERLVMNKLSKVKRFDTVVVKVVDKNNQKQNYVKRVIGLPGETVEMKNDQLYIDGKKYNEPYLANYKKLFKKDQLQNEYKYNAAYQEVAAAAKNFTTDFKATVPAGHYFVMGDNRLISNDSRYIGSIASKDMEGSVFVSFWPLNKIKWIQ